MRDLIYKYFSVLCVFGFINTHWAFADGINNSSSNNQSVQSANKKSQSKISQDFFEFATEFSDDDEGMMQLLAEDADGNLDAGMNVPESDASDSAKNSDQLPKRKKKILRQQSSTSSSNSGGETL